MKRIKGNRAEELGRAFTDETLMDELTSRLRQLKTFSEIGKALTSSLDLKEIIAAVMEQIRGLLKPTNWSLLLLDEEKEELRFEIAVGEGADRIKDLKLKLGEGIAGWVAKEGRPLLIADVSKDPRFSKKADELSRFETKSIVCVPLRARGKSIGVIELLNAVENESFGEEDLLLLTTLADYAAIAIENALLFDRVQLLTITDDLTHLYNSRYMHRFLDYELARVSRYESHLSMLFMDLDYFKDVNDRYGHISGSKLLAEVAQVILKNIRNVDVACRYGGDEFVVLMPETPKTRAMNAAKKIKNVIRETVFLKDAGTNCHITISIGVASFPEDAKNKVDLIHLADKAMYSVKSLSRDGVAMA
ncbi:MAG: sensor domain-containing diguanylate cyclase [Deltaproteobacteria bacterium]|nr:sensor domain-containing diguanylate cyclase [Deltaproteobacteria bacterium]